jgi:hypothetical protein
VPMVGLMLSLFAIELARLIRLLCQHAAPARPELRGRSPARS